MASKAILELIEALGTAMNKRVTLDLRYHHGMPADWNTTQITGIMTGFALRWAGAGTDTWEALIQDEDRAALRHGVALSRILSWTEVS